MMSAVLSSRANPFVSDLPHALPRVAPRLDRYSLAGWATLAWHGMQLRSDSALAAGSLRDPTLQWDASCFLMRDKWLEKGGIFVQVSLTPKRLPWPKQAIARKKAP